MGCDNGRRIYNRITETFRLFPLSFGDPDRRQMERRFKRRDTCDLFFDISRVHRHIVVKQNLTLCDLNTLDLDNILIWIQLNVITQTDDRHNGTKLQCDLPPDHYNTIQKVSTLIYIRKRNDSISEFQLDRIHLQQGNHILRLSDLLRVYLILVHFILDLFHAYALLHLLSADDKHQTKSDKQIPF
ncbi:unknown [Roseburia sp. CAG:182]|nr:unknown [Roseburia sp. CAG:182]